MSERNICDMHKEIRKYADEIIKIRSFQYDTVTEVLTDVQFIAKQINSVIDEALEAGQSMEDRLSEYRDAIEGLGFKRDK